MVWPRSAYLIDVLFNRFYNVYMGFVYNGMAMFTMFTKKKKRKKKKWDRQNNKYKTFHKSDNTINFTNFFHDC